MHHPHPHHTPHPFAATRQGSAPPQHTDQHTPSNTPETLNPTSQKLSPSGPDIPVWEMRCRAHPTSPSTEYPTHIQPSGVPKPTPNPFPSFVPFCSLPSNVKPDATSNPATITPKRAR